MTFPLLTENFPSPPQISTEAPGVSNIPSEFSRAREKRLAKKEEPKRISALNRAGKSAFERLNKVIGDGQDRDVQFYNGLTQNDMGRLVSFYGPDEVARYTKAMEKKRLNRR